MSIFLIIFLSFLLMSFIGAMYFSIRNTYVLEFRLWIVNAIPDDEHFDEYFLIYTSVTYTEMLYSFKPLKLKNWYPELVGKINVK